MKNEFRDKEWLIEQIKVYGYVKKISRETGYSETSIDRYIKKYELKGMLTKPSKDDLKHALNIEKFPYQDVNWLVGQIEKHKHIAEICRNTGYPSTSVRRYIKKYNLVTESAPISRRLSINEDYFKVIDTENKAYWLGLLVADGNVTDSMNKYCIRILLKGEDGYLLKRFLRDIGSDSKVSYDKLSRATARVFCKKMFHDLANLGVIPRKTGKETLPNIPEELMNHFVRGFFDGDGTIYKRSNRKRHKCTIGLVCQNYHFLFDINNKIIEHTGCSLGNISTHKNNAYEIKTESLNMCTGIMTWLYKDANITMLRKYEKSKQLLNINCPSLEQFKEESRLIAGTCLEP